MKLVIAAAVAMTLAACAEAPQRPMTPAEAAYRAQMLQFSAQMLQPPPQPQPVRQRTCTLMPPMAGFQQMNCY